jgi:hypothetical protein
MTNELILVISILLLLVAAAFGYVLLRCRKRPTETNMNAEDRQKIHAEFVKKFQDMLDLVARGRGIEILLRIADQTEKGLAAVDESYESMISSDLRIDNPHPRAAAPSIFHDEDELKRIELARDIADKLAHGLFRQARKLIRRYRDSYSLKTVLNDDKLPGWRVDAAGHLTEEDGRRIVSIVDMLSSSNDNLIMEEFDLFVHNDYADAAIEIFDDAWRRIASSEKSLSVRVEKLHMFRGFKRGERTYVEEDNE